MSSLHILTIFRSAPPPLLLEVLMHRDPLKIPENDAIIAKLRRHYFTLFCLRSKVRKDDGVELSKDQRG